MCRLRGSQSRLAEPPNATLFTVANRFTGWASWSVSLFDVPIGEPTLSRDYTTNLLGQANENKSTAGRFLVHALRFDPSKTWNTCFQSEVVEYGSLVDRRGGGMSMKTLGKHGSFLTSRST